MQELFENKISSKIKNTFENYEEPYNEASWILMKDKLQNKKKSKVVFFYNFAKAAVIFLIIGISSLLIVKSGKKTNSDSQKFSQTIILYQNTRNNNNNTFDYSNSNDNKIVDEIEDNDFITNNTNKKDDKIYLNFENNKNNENHENENIVIENINHENEMENILSDTLIDLVVDNSIDCLKIDLDKDNIIIDESIFEQKKKKKEKRISIGVALASNYNYSAEYVSENMNFGGGITGDFKIFKNFSINTGLIFGNQNMEVGSKGFLAADEANYLADNIASEEINSKINLLSFDIPLNVQYDIKNFFISTGISSFTYLSEKYEYSYFTRETVDVLASDGSTSEEMAYIESESETKVGAFQRFDIAKLFNFSFGYKVPLKKGELVFEPYLKLPIGELTTGDIAFGVGGMSVKYKF